MMRTLTVDSNNDICLNTLGNLAISSDLQAILFACENTVKAQYGEMIYAIDRGIPYNILAWDRQPNLIQLEAFIRRAITNIEGVVGIKEFIINNENNLITYSVVIKTKYGEGSLNELRISN